MKLKTRKLLSAFLLAVFAVSTAILLRNFFAFQQGDGIYEDARSLAFSSGKPVPTAETLPQQTISEKEAETIWVPAPLEEEDPQVVELQALDITALQQINEDVLGWIRIPGTEVDYPLLAGTDNEFYLEHNWKGEKAYVGSIFLECQNRSDLTDYNTILYGHNIVSGAMFGSLHKYQHDAYWKMHPYIYIVTEAGILRYEIFSSYNAAVDSQTYSLSFRKDETKRDFLIMALEYSDINTGITPDLTDRILTLSTCNGSGYISRRVVQARLKMVEKTAE